MPPLDWEFPTALGYVAPEADTALHVGADSTHYAAWIGHHLAPDQPAIWLSRRPAGGVWTVPEMVWRQEGGVIVEVDVVTDAIGLVHVVWSGTTAANLDIMHVVRGANGGWSKPAAVSKGTPLTDEVAPTAASDLWGNVHVVWLDRRLGGSDLFHSRIRPGAAPGTNVRVAAGPSGAQAEPSIAVSSGGDLYAAWTETASALPVIRASQIPHAGLGPDVADADIVWWPAATLSNSTARQARPVLLAGVHQRVVVVWVDGGRRLRAARFGPDSPYWEADQVVYSSSGSDIGALAGATDMAGRAFLAWEETDGSGAPLVLAGTLPETGLVAAGRADYSPLSSAGTRPRLGADGASALGILFTGADRGGAPTLFTRVARLPDAGFPYVVHEGWLGYAPGRKSCPGDGYLIAGCDGATGPWVTAAVDPRLLGRWVKAEGLLVEGVRCPRLLATRIVLAPPPCPRTEGAVTGVITAGGAPVAGAEVQIGATTARTGPSGRFFVSNLQGGRHAVSATVQCGLLASAPVQVQAEFTTVMPDAELVRADVQKDCVIDLMDLVRVTLAYHTEPPYHPVCADLNADGLVDVADVAAVASAYDATCPTDWQPTAAALDAAHQVDVARAATGKVAGARLVYRGSGRPIAWAATLRWVGEQAMPRFALEFGAGSWVVEDAVAGNRRELAAARVSGPFADGDVLAHLPDIDTEALRVADFAMAGVGGRPVHGTVELESIPGCRGIECGTRAAFIPRALR
jgi:hypothetical protein